MLDLLNVPVESQVLVYTQTSQQAEKIMLDNPRAIYFNDTVSVGYMRGGGILEIVAQDPAGFDLLRDRSAEGPAAQHRPRSAMPALPFVVGHARRARHERAEHVPARTEMDYANGFFVDHYRPIDERWGGWYVTGKSVPARHMGNLPLFVRSASPRRHPRECRWKGNSISTVT